MPNNPCSKWHKCFNLLKILAVFAWCGQCSAKCSDIPYQSVYAFSEAETPGYQFFNITADLLEITPTSPNVRYKEWLDVNETIPGFWEVILKKSFDADVSDSGTVDFRCDRPPNSADFMEINFLCKDTPSTPSSTGQPLLLYFNVLDVNDFAPYFEHSEYQVTISEDHQNGTNVATVLACDPDRNRIGLVYAIVSYLEGSAGYFDIPDRFKGNVTLVKELDYESGTTSFVLNISATEHSDAGAGLVNYTTLTINITDIDDVMPEFVNPPYKLSIPEGLYTGRQRFDTTPHLSARDGDYHINETILFKISRGSQNTELFSVANNGWIVVNGSLKTGAYNILVEAYQIDKPNLRYVTTIVTITATDINDHKPEMGQSLYNVTVEESLPVGTQILTVDAIDEDVGNNSVIEFHINGTGANMFSVETRDHMGIIKLIRPLDRESESIYTLQIWAKETLTREGYSSNISQVVIYVADVNDNSPVFMQYNYTFDVIQTQVKGDFVGKVSAVDIDAGGNGQITYAVSFSTLQPSAFTMDNITGNISLSRNLGHSDVGVHHLSVSATDNPADTRNRRSTSAQVTVNILPANTSPPTFANQTLTFNVSEITPPGSLVGTVTATDNDGDTVKYSISPNSYFSLNQTSGRITVKKIPDLEDSQSPAPSVVNFTVNASDGLYNERTNVEVFIVAVNEFSPIFRSQVPVHIFENETEGEFVFQVNATDKDAGFDGNVTFSLLPSVGRDLFKVDPDTGRITLNCSNCLDPGRGNYDLIVQAKDGGSPPLTDTISVPVTIQRTKFAPPRFTQKDYYISVKENQTPQFVLQLSAYDDDTRRSELNYSLVSTTARNLPVVIFSNGSIYINGSFDAEKDNEFVLNVSVSDGHGRDDAQVIVNITDVNEFPPRLNITGRELVQIPENINITEFVAAVSANDSDVSNDDFSYFLSAGADGKFVIDPKTGIITVSGPLDRSLKSDYNITVSVFDHGLPPLLSSGSLIVQVIDSNHAPYFKNGSATVSHFDFYIPENLTVGDLVGSLQAADPDTGSSGQYSFRLQPDVSSSYFYLDKDSGNLKLAKSLNYEERANFNLTVIVSDKSQIPKNATAKVTVHVENVEEAPEWPLSLSTVYVVQSSVCKNQQLQLQTLSHEVTSVSCKSDYPVDYSLVNMTTEFSINNTSGLLKINNTLKEGVYGVWLRACNRNPTVCSDAVLTVVVQNKKSLAFCPTFYTVDVNSTAFVNFSFLDLNTTEGDTGVSYSISAGNTEGRFHIGKQDGKLYVAEKLSKRKTFSYTLSISAEDLSSHDVAAAQVLVRVLDVANETLQFSATTYHGEILESQQVGSHVFQPFTDIPLAVVATSNDENSQLTYSLNPTSDSSNGSFTITINGTIILAQKIDYEKIPVNFNKTYTLTVNATDGVSFGTATVVVHVQDVNDNPPKFDDPADLVTNVTEGQTSGQGLVLVNATDPDTHTTLVYSLNVTYPAAGAPLVFYIDQSSGMITILRDLDREDKDKYILTVTVSDGKFSINKTVTVNVLDANDNSPFFNQTFKMTVVEGDLGVGTNISVTAFDADLGGNADINYTVVSGNINGTFEFDSVNKNILKTVKALDKESIFNSHGADIILTIVAVDTGNTSLSGTGTVLVTITDIDDNPPQFSQKRYTAQVSEDAINVTVTLTPQLDLTDADVDDCPTYLFSLSDNSTPFAVNKSSGILFVKEKLDRETHENYTLQVIAIDNCGKGLNSSAEIFIEILDVDDEPPEFLEPVYNFNISKNSRLRQIVGTVMAKDVDTSGDFIVYRLSGSDMFYIDPRQGEIFLIGDLSSGNVFIFNLAVSACDAGVLQQCGNATVHISVTGMCPVWNTTSLNLTAREGDTGLLGYISTLHDDFSNVSYFLSDTVGKQWLNISPSGEVTLHTPFKADKLDKASYMVSVYVEDYSQPNCSQPGTLAVFVSGSNDNDPVICYQGLCGDPDIEITISDGSPEKSLIALIAAHDNDTGLDGEVNLTLTTITKGLADLFYLTSNELILKKQINLKNITANSSLQNDTIDLILTARDNGQPSRSTNTSVRVKVLAQGDAFGFTNQTYFMDVKENEKPMTVVGRVTATVKSSSSSSITFKYSIYVPYGNVPFDINPTNGTITTIGALDRETEGHYLFSVVATNPSQPQVSALALVVMNVTDVNESPKFDNSNITLLASENKAPINLATLTARDDDEGSNGIVTYILTSGSRSNFEVNTTTGVLSVVQALDRENISSYDLVIEAVDGGSPALSASLAVHIIVTDTNDHAPNFTQSNYEYNITTSVPPVKVTTITATDDDEGLNKEIKYSLQSEYNHFKIDPLSGEIESISILSKNIYNLVVMAKDQGNPALNSTVDVNIRLIDNRTSIVPYLSLSTNFLSLIVGQKAGKPLSVKITTQDADSLYISDGNGTIFFEIQKDQIILRQDLTQETVYIVIITATSTTGQNVSKELEVHVDRIKFSQQSYTAAVVENTQSPLTLLDIDSNAEKLRIPVIYSLNSLYSEFHIVSTTGVLSVLHPLDRETFSVYVLNVSLALDPSVTSLYGRRKRAASLDEASTTILIQVKDQNDNRPSFDNLGSELHLSVAASVNTSFLITTLKAYDPDEGMNGLVRYIISSGDNGAFDLNPVSGELRVASPEKLSNQSVFMLTVVATDRNGTGVNVSLDVWITTEQKDDQFRLSTPLSVSKLNANKETILKSLGRILGLNLSLVRVTMHEESGNVDPDRSDILFQAYQPNTNTTTIMSVSQIQTLVSEHEADIHKLFKSFETQPQASKNDDDDDMNVTSISLIVVACVMFVATLVAIIVSCRMWKKQKKYEDKVARMRSTANLKAKENAGKDNYASVNSGHIELTIVSEESAPSSAVDPSTAGSPVNGYLQQVQQSLQVLASESADSGVASPISSDSDASGEDSLAVAQRNTADEDNNEAPGSTAETGDGTREVQNEQIGNSLVQKHAFVNITLENSEEEGRSEPPTQESDPIENSEEEDISEPENSEEEAISEPHTQESVHTANNSSDETSSLNLPFHNSLSAIGSNGQPVSSSHDALPQNSISNELRQQSSDNNISQQSTAPPTVSTSTYGLSFLNKAFEGSEEAPAVSRSTPGLSFLNKAFDSSEQAEVDSDEEAITHF